MTLRHALGLEVIAEAIETKEQERIALEAGCDGLQGYRYSAAVSADDLDRLLLKRRDRTFALAAQAIAEISKLIETEIGRTASCYLGPAVECWAGGGHMDKVEHILPRRAERKPVQGTAALRRSGHNKVPVTLLDLSTHGFRIETFGGIIIGTPVWITLPGLASIEAKVVWARGDQAGCEFFRPLHPSVLEDVLRRAS